MQALLREGKITAGHARALVGREDAAQVAERIVDQQLTVRDVETVLQSVEATIEARMQELGVTGIGSPPQGREPQGKDADTVAFEKDLSDALGLNVEVKPGSGESGYLSIRYSNFEQLDYVRNRLLGVYG